MNVKKKERASLFLSESIHLFQCPICKQSFEKVEEGTLYCVENHTFDVSKKGTVHFLLKQSKNEYNKEMLESRTKIATAGLWKPLLEEIIEVIETPEGTHLDVGCGEGTHLHHLSTLGLKGSKIGFDISKDAIQLAAAQYTEAFWCVADLADSPFQTTQYDTILNILSPSNYAEFDRLLKENGQVIKVVPNEGYLKELREALYEDQKPYSNKEVVENFYKQYDSVSEKNVTYQWAIKKEDRADLIRMTPLAWNASDKKKEELLEDGFDSITVDLTILIGKYPKKSKE
jgi:23S rRNA (guanine745-N1)-methyltransferase/PadR family transcriptional regulator PadR